jgi:type III secretory pathway component EscS
MLAGVVEEQILLLALVGLVVVALAQQETQQDKQFLGLQIRAVAVVEMAVLLHHFCQEQAVQVSSSLNTSPNLITKSSNHQAHGLHLLALLRSSI